MGNGGGWGGANRTKFGIYKMPLRQKQDGVFSEFWNSGQSLISSHAIALSLDTIFAKKVLIFLQRNAEISKTKGVMVLKGVSSETSSAYVLMHQIISM